MGAVPTKREWRDPYLRLARNWLTPAWNSRVEAWSAGDASLALMSPIFAIKSASFLASFPSSALSVVSSLDRIRLTFSFSADVLSSSAREVSQKGVDPGNESRLFFWMLVDNCSGVFHHLV